MTSYASTGRLKPLSSSGPTSRQSTGPTIPCLTRCETRIWSARGHGAQPGGEVGHRADRGVVVAAREADPAERGVALRDAHPEAEVVSLAAPPLRQLGDPGPHVHRHPHRTVRCVRAGDGVVEEDEQPVAGEVLEGALVREHQLAERQVVVGQHLHGLLRLAALGERGEATQVGEHRDDLAAVAAQERLVTGVDHDLGDLRRQEAAQPAEPVELGDLGVDALLEVLVQLGERGRLRGHGVVVALDPHERAHPRRAARPG